MESRVQIVAILVTSGLFGIVFELVRRRQLMERYALLWMLAALVLLLLAVWKGLLERIASAIGIFYAPSAIFVIAFGFVLVLLLHYSLVISKLSDQNKLLAQKLGMLQQRVESLGAAAAAKSDPEPAHDRALQHDEAADVPERVGSG
jgi:hypothetical protein